MIVNLVQPFLKNPAFLVSSSSSSSFSQNFQSKLSGSFRYVEFHGNRRYLSTNMKERRIICGGFLPVDPWAPSIDSQSIASQLFAFSIFPYAGFLYFLTKSNTAPKLTLFGFYFLLAFVGATTKVHYGTSLSNVDWLHGGAESLLTLTNLFIVLGLMGALRKLKHAKLSDSAILEDDNNNPPPPPL